MSMAQSAYVICICREGMRKITQFLVKQRRCTDRMSKVSVELDTIWTVYHLAIYMQSNKIHSVL